MPENTRVAERPHSFRISLPPRPRESGPHLRLSMEGLPRFRKDPACPEIWTLSEHGDAGGYQIVRWAEVIDPDKPTGTPIAYLYPQFLDALPARINSADELRKLAILTRLPVHALGMLYSEVGFAKLAPLAAFSAVLGLVSGLPAARAQYIRDELKRRARARAIPFGHEADD